MSIVGSLFVASDALDVLGNAISVAGDNIANLNTVGFKASRIEFADLLSTIDGQLEIGHGVRLADVSKILQQGALETTQSLTDLAIEGGGFFILKNGAGETFYSRAGEFHFDANSNLVNPLGLFLQGASGNISLGAALTLPAQATTSLGLKVNLDAAAATPGAAFPAGPDASPGAWNAAGNFSSVTTVYDSAGAAHDLTFLFRKNGANSWEYRILAQRSELDAGASTSTDLRDLGAGGTLQFNPDGSFNAAGSTVSGITGLSWVGGGTQTIAPGSLSFDGSVQYAQPSSLMSLSTNGYGGGFFTGVSIDGGGAITGRYSNGVTRPIGTIVLANFTSPDGLDPAGDGLYRATAESGAALTGAPGQNGMGQIVSGALEMSTVDLAREMVALITSQRSFQINSRVITVADQMYAEAAELKQ
ncbi:MAG: flagellar hook protein FlgE [Deltaproteobacteria bacterium]|nr:flagellar hook protein FlgE [Deltaproteobacteria bacterium]